MAFWAFEGIDGAGKSTLMGLVKTELTRRNQKVIHTREPGGTPLGEELRTLLLRSDGDPPTPRAELLLYEAIRAQHVEKIILPAIQRGDWILCDRFTASTLAFQAGGREMARGPIDWLNDFATRGLEPDLAILLDLDIKKGQERMEGRQKDRFELEKDDFHDRVRNGYLNLAKESPEKWVILDASQSPEVLFESLLPLIERAL